MKTIEIDDDVYSFIAQHTKEIGESASNILRRLFKLGAVETTKPILPTEHELSRAFSDPKFRVQLNAVDKFLYILGAAYAQKKNEFDKVLAIQGRGRKYFAKSRKEIVESGNSTQPRQIPDSSYWVMTNSTTPQKREMLREVLQILDFSEEATRTAASAFTPRLG